jgi:non-specific protein-tyrosine kinase
LQIHDYVRALRKHVVLILVFLVIGIGLSAALVARSKPSYTSSESILVSGSDSTNDANQVAANRISSYLTVAGSDLVANRVDESLAGKVPTGTYSIAAANPTGTAIIELKATAATPTAARLVTTQSVSVFIAVVREIEVNASSGGKPVSTLVAIGEASVPVSASTSNSLILALGAAVGLFLGVAGALLRYSLDSSLQDVDQAEAELGAGVLGAVPLLKRRARSQLFVGDRGAAGDEFHKIAVRAHHRAGGGDPRILVASSVRGEGCSTVARNLACALALNGVPTVLVTEEQFANDSTEPVARQGKSAPRAQMRLRHPVDSPNDLRVVSLPEDARTDSDRAATNWAQEALKLLANQTPAVPRTVVVDAGPSIDNAETEIIADLCTHVVVVVETGRTDRAIARRTMRRFAGYDLPVVGVVLTPKHRRGRWR